MTYIPYFYFTLTDRFCSLPLLLFLYSYVQPPGTWKFSANLTLRDCITLGEILTGVKLSSGVSMCTLRMGFIFFPTLHSPWEKPIEQVYPSLDLRSRLFYFYVGFYVDTVGLEILEDKQRASEVPSPVIEPLEKSLDWL